MRGAEQFFGRPLASGAAAQSGPQTYTLKVTPETVAWGNYNAAAKPVLDILPIAGAVNDLAHDAVEVTRGDARLQFG